MANITPVPRIPLLKDPAQDDILRRWLAQLRIYNNTLAGGPYTVGDIFYANSVSTMASLPDVAVGNVLISGGVSTAPAWGKVTSLHLNPDVIALLTSYG